LRIRQHLTLRGVAGATRKIAILQDNEEFAISHGRLSGIENKGVVSNIYRLHSLAAIYLIDYRQLLSWFGIPLD
jgi:hypothetical protein